MKFIIFMVALIAHFMILLLMIRAMGAFYAPYLGMNPVLQRIRQLTRSWLVPFQFLPAGRYDFPALFLSFLLAALVAILKGISHPLAVIILGFYELFVRYADVLIYSFIFMAIYEAIAPPRSEHPLYEMAQTFTDWISTPLSRILPVSQSFNWTYLAAIALVMTVRFMISLLLF